jgi:hypothetical protein
MPKALLQPHWLRALWLVAVLLGVPLLAVIFNPFSQASVEPSIIAGMNDVPTIIKGYHQTPHLWPDSLKWWHGPPVQYDVGVLRPLASYLLWIETAVGLRWGFFWTGCIGLLLFIADCWLAVAVAWRFTGSRWCALVAAVLAPSLRFFNYGGQQQPADWIVWYAVHQDLLLIGWLLGALLAFCAWLDTNRKAALIATWACFLLGALTKEFGYIFPVMALVLVHGRRREVATRAAWIQVAAMAGVVALLLLYRRAVLPFIYNPPPLTLLQLIRKPWMYWFGSFDRYLFVHAYWMVGLGLLVFAYFGAFLHWRRQFGSRLAGAQGWAIAGGVFLLILCLYLIVPGWLPDIMGNFMNWRDTEYFLFDLAAMVLTLYSISLLWKYRRDEPSLAAWLLMALAYIPIFTFEGWHYTIAGWFLRSAIYWPLVAKLAYRDLSRAGH